jgi:serine protease Do
MRRIELSSLLKAFAAAASVAVVAVAAVCTCGTQRGHRIASTEAGASSGPSLPDFIASPAWAQATIDEDRIVGIADVAAKVTPSVVTLSTSKTRKSRGFGGFPGGDLFERFFGGPGMKLPDSPSERLVRGLGSGVILDAEGYIVTNAHTVSGMDDIAIELADGRFLEPEVVGIDEGSDLALLRIKAQGLPALNLARSSELRVGEVVLAVGNPFGVGQTVTMGIVSALGRAGMGINDYEDFIQTDAAINPGNSGGALVDLRGHLVGINTAIISRSGAYQGIGFAVPSDMVHAIVSSLREHGRVVRGFIGVGIQDLTPNLVQALEIEGAERGALVTEVEPDSPAAQAGVQPQDVIVAVNERRVENAAQLQSSIASIQPGSEVELEVIREDERLELTATLVERSGDAAEAGEAPTIREDSLLRGLEVTLLRPDLRAELRVPDGVSGVVITSVDPTSPAARAGVRRGDLVTSVNQTPVDSPASYATAAAQATDGVLLRVIRQGRPLFLAWH